MSIMFLKDQSFKKIGETNFRELYHQYIYIKGATEFLKGLNKIEINADDNGIIAYGYIDDQAGFSFRFLCSASLKNNILSQSKYNEKVGIILRKGNFNDFEYINLKQFDIDTSEFDKTITIINDKYKSKNKYTEEMREFTFLDEVRSIDYPDDIQIILAQDGLNPEQVWGKCWAYSEKELFAKLLNEPYQNFGVHNGSIIGFAPVKNKDKILCIYTGRYLEEQE